MGLDELDRGGGAGGGGLPDRVGVRLRGWWVEGHLEARLPRPGQDGLRPGEQGADGGVQLRRLEARPGQKLSEAEIDDFVRKTVIPTIRDQVKQLRAIPPPKGEKAHVEEIYKALDKGLDVLQENPKKLSDGSNVFGDADTLAKKYGITVCASTG